MAVFEHRRGDRMFELKTIALRAQLRLDEHELADVLREARVLEQRLKDAVSA